MDAIAILFTEPKKLEEFKHDHQEHLNKLKNAMYARNKAIPDISSGRRMLTKGKVIISSLVSDNTVLRAMRSNEKDINEAYNNIIARQDLWDEIKAMIDHSFEHEKRHQAWYAHALE